MATSKTLAPTNVTISIPAMADAPDASVFSNCVDKEADAINALNSHFVTTSASGTTDSNGNLVTNFSRNDYVVLNANAGGNLVLNWVQAQTDGGKIVLKVVNSNTLGNVSNAQVTVYLMLYKTNLSA